jgi:hypothetical protein
VVRMETGIERHISISVTDLSPNPIQYYPLPLDLSSVRELLSVYARMIRLTTERTEDGYPDQNSPHFSSEATGSVPTDPISRPLDISIARTTAESHAGTGNNVPSDRPADHRRTGEKE